MSDNNKEKLHNINKINRLWIIKKREKIKVPELMLLIIIMLPLILSACQIPFFFDTNPLRSVNWVQAIAAQQPGCTANPNDIADGRFGLRDLVDVTGDGKQDAFVLVGCNRPAPIIDSQQHLEVFDGASDPARPQRIGTLLECEVTQTSTSTVSSWHGCDIPRDVLIISGNTITVIYGVEIDKGNLNTVASTNVYLAKITNVFFWNGSKFIRRSHSETPQQPTKVG